MSRPRLVRDLVLKETGGGFPRPGTPGRGSDPRPEWVVGTCPLCAGPLVRNNYYVGGRGLVLIEECWHSLTFVATCTYRMLV